jgi:hypothetical protein
LLLRATLGASAALRPSLSFLYFFFSRHSLFSRLLLFALTDQRSLRRVKKKEPAGSFVCFASPILYNLEVVANFNVATFTPGFGFLIAPLEKC